MPTEIERKFLVIGQQWQTADPTYYCQGYLNHDPERTVRVRIAGDKAMLTIKGPTTGATRAEYEYEIPVEDAREMLAMCPPPLIEKNRRLIDHAGMRWEVDEFLGDNAGLVVAEIELESEQQKFDLPPWIGQEVTDDARYYNSRLAQQPFTTW